MRGTLWGDRAHGLKAPGELVVDDGFRGGGELDGMEGEGGLSAVFDGSVCRPPPSYRPATGGTTAVQGEAERPAGRWATIVPAGPRRLAAAAARYWCHGMVAAGGGEVK